MIHNKLKRGAIINLKNMTIALIISLAYEILLKLSHLFIPSLFNISFVSNIISLLSFIVGAIVILFIFLFYKEEEFNKKVKIVLKILIGCIVLIFIFRLPIIRNITDYKIQRLIIEIIGFIKAILLFIILIFYKSEIPYDKQFIKKAAVFLTVMFGIGIIKSLYSLFTFLIFVISGTIVNYPPIFYSIMIIIFLITHISIIFFLHRYYQLKFYEQ